MEAAVTAFLESLRNDQIDNACFAFSDETVRRDWTYLPRQRPGLSLTAMTGEQQKLASQLLATALSTQAFATAAVIMALEDVLDEIEGGGLGRWPRRSTAWPATFADVPIRALFRSPLTFHRLETPRFEHVVLGRSPTRRVGAWSTASAGRRMLARDIGSVT
jgi:hypothetical protein